jgi:hypothetical protein
MISRISAANGSRSAAAAGGPGGYGGADISHSAGIADIARDSGDDTMHVDEASALEDTLARLRQRYALYFYFPEGLGQAETVKIDLSQEARLRYQDAEIHYRRVYMSCTGAGERPGETITHAQRPGDTLNESTYHRMGTHPNAGARPSMKTPGRA